jgi:hypothetical protein
MKRPERGMLDSEGLIAASRVASFLHRCAPSKCVKPMVIALSRVVWASWWRENVVPVPNAREGIRLPSLRGSVGIGMLVVRGGCS